MNGPEPHRQSSPAALRNRDAILDVLRSALPDAGLVLEVASGTGEHVVHFASRMPGLEWQPSDPSPVARASIAEGIAAESLPNVRGPVDLDAGQSAWPVARADAMVCINMVHISPWEATIGLMRGAGQVLPADGLLYLYGPYRRGERPLEPGNAAFDLDLRARDPRWGLRELDDVIRCAAAHGLGFERSVEMPANNLSVIFRRTRA